MDGADDEVKGMRKTSGYDVVLEVGLKSQFQADHEIDPVLQTLPSEEAAARNKLSGQIQSRYHRPYNHSPCGLSGTDGTDRERARAQS